MAPMTGKMPLTLRSVVLAIPKEPGERGHQDWMHRVTKQALDS